MKHFTLIIPAVVAVALLTTGCYAKYTFPSSDVAPAAQAEVKLTRDGNGNVEVDFKAKHLAAEFNKNFEKFADGVGAGQCGSIEDQILAQVGLGRGKPREAHRLVGEVGQVDGRHLQVGDGIGDLGSCRLNRHPVSTVR